MEKTKVFISYSRKDLNFVERLYKSLREKGYDCNYDKAEHDDINSGLSEEDEWWDRLKVHITECDVMIFIVSPASAASKVCDEEIAYAKALSKRVIPILLMPVDFNKVPPRLGALNVKLSFLGDNENEYNAQFNKLCLVLDKDIIWHREIRRYLEAAVRWNNEEKPESLLLRPDQLRIGLELTSRRPVNVEEPPDLLFDFFRSSQEFEDGLEKKRRRLMGAAYVIPAREALKNEHYDYALRLMAAGCIAADDFDFALVPELWHSAARAIFEIRLISRLYGHSDGVMSVALSENGNIVATGSQDNTIRIWNSRKGHCIDILEGHSSSIWALKFGPISGNLFSASSDGKLIKWDLESKTKSVIWSAKGLTGINKFTIDNSEHRLFAVLQNKEAIALELNENSLTHKKLKGHEGYIRDICLSPNGKIVATSSEDKTIRLWCTDSSSCLAVLIGHEDEVNSIAFSPDSNMIASCSGGMSITHDRTVRLWNCEKLDEQFGEQIGVFGEHDRRVSCLDFHPTKMIVASGSTDRTLKIWDAKEMKIMYNLSPDIGMISVVQFSPDGTRLLAVSDLGRGILIDTKTGSKICRLDRHDSSIWSVAFSGDGTTIATSSLDKTASIWDAHISPKFLEDKENQGPGLHEFMPTPSFDSRKQRRVLTPRNNTASVNSEKDGAELILIHNGNSRIESGGFVGGVNRLMFTSSVLDQAAEVRDVVWTTGIEKGVSYWDVTKTRFADAPPILLLIAALSNGQGQLAGGEPKGFLFDNAPNDLYMALIEKVGSRDRIRIRELATFLRNKMHPNCYS